MKPRESSSGRGHFRESRKWLFPTKFAGRASGVQARRQSFAGEEKFRRRSLHRPITIVPRSFDQARGGAEDRREEGGGREGGDGGGSKSLEDAETISRFTSGTRGTQLTDASLSPPPPLPDAVEGKTPPLPSGAAVEGLL